MVLFPYELDKENNISHRDEEPHVQTDDNKYPEVNIDRSMILVLLHPIEIINDLAECVDEDESDAEVRQVNNVWPTFNYWLVLSIWCAETPVFF